MNYVFDNLTGREVIELDLIMPVLDALNKAMEEIVVFGKESVKDKMTPWPFNYQDFVQNRQIEHYWLVFDGKRIVSILSVEYSDEFELRMGTIFNVYTDPDYRGRGLAKQNMMAAIEFITSRGMIPKLFVYESNTNAREFYEHLGFKTTERTMMLL